MIENNPNCLIWGGDVYVLSFLLLVKVPAPQLNHLTHVRAHRARIFTHIAGVTFFHAFLTAARTSSSVSAPSSFTARSMNGQTGSEARGMFMFCDTKNAAGECFGDRMPLGRHSVVHA